MDTFKPSRVSTHPRNKCDFKITINPVLEGTKYPLPKIEYLYANVSCSKYFLKIHLKDTYTTNGY